MKQIILVFSLLVLFIGEPSFAMAIVANSGLQYPEAHSKTSQKVCEDKDGKIICPQ